MNSGAVTNTSVGSRPRDDDSYVSMYKFYMDLLYIKAFVIAQCPVQSNKCRRRCI